MSVRLVIGTSKYTSKNHASSNNHWAKVTDSFRTKWTVTLRNEGGNYQKRPNMGRSCLHYYNRVNWLIRYISVSTHKNKPTYTHIKLCVFISTITLQGVNCTHFPFANWSQILSPPSSRDSVAQQWKSECTSTVKEVSSPINMRY